MKISEERKAEIRAFKNTDFLDCPELTDEQIRQLRPSHYRKKTDTVFNEMDITTPKEQSIIVTVDKLFEESVEQF